MLIYSMFYFAVLHYSLGALEDLHVVLLSLYYLFRLLNTESIAFDTNTITLSILVHQFIEWLWTVSKPFLENNTQDYKGQKELVFLENHKNAWELHHREFFLRMEI